MWQINEILYMETYVSSSAKITKLSTETYNSLTSITIRHIITYKSAYYC